MAVYAQLADGRLLEFPDGTSQAAMDKAIKNFVLSERGPETGLGAKALGGLKGLASDIQTGIESLFDARGAAERGLERREELGMMYAPGADLNKVKEAYRQRGLLGGAGEVVSQVPGALAEQAPIIAATLGSAKLGAMAGTAVAPGIGTIVGGLAGAAAPTLAQLFGANIQRQAEAGAPEISRTKAAAAAVPGAALEVAATFIPLGRTVVGKLLGPAAEEALKKGAKESVEKLAQESMTKALTKGVGMGVLAEVPTEISQQILERFQAGLPLTSDDALAEYGRSAYGASLVGGPFGAVGRVAQRGVARGRVEERQAEERRLQEELATAEREQAAAAEEARKQTPEYRQELNDRIWTLKDELAQVEPIAKDKTQDEDVRNEAIARAKEIKNELKDLQTKFKESMKEAGLAPTFEQAKAAGVREMPVVDEYGNIVKPKGKYLSEEKYGQQLEGAAKQWDQTREKIFELREKDIAEQEAKKQKVEAAVDSQVQRYLRSLDEYDTLLEEEKIQKGLKAREEKAKEVTFQRAMERIQKVIDNFGFNLIGYQSDPTVQQLKTQIADLSRPEAIAAAPDRNAYLQQLDTLKTQLADAVDNAPHNSGEGLRRLIDEGRVTRDVTNALGIKGLGGRSVSATDALPNIQARIDELEEKRQEFTKRIPETSLMENDGTLTKAGVQLVKNEVKLNELKRLKAMAGETETGGEAAAAGILEFAAGKTDEYIPVEKNLPGVQYNNRIQEANKKAAGAFDDIVSFIDDLSKKRFFGGAPGQVGLASTTEESLRKNIDAAQTQLIDGLLEEVATARVARKLRPLSQAEATGLAMDVNSLVDMLVTRSTAPAPGMISATRVTPAQMRGAKIVKGAEEVTGDFRGVRELPFGASAKKAKMMSPEEQEKIAKKLKEFRALEREATERLENADKRISKLEEAPDSPLSQELAQARAQAFEDVRTARAAKEEYKQAIKSNFASTGITAKQALQTVKNVIRSIKQDIIAEGQRPVRADKGTLQLLKTPQKVAPADLVKDLDRVLRMGNLQPDVASTLEAARRRMEEGGVSVGLEELIEEQVGRILRGTDRPFVLERDVTKPGGRRAMGAAGTAELLDEIKTQMRFDAEQAQFTGEQMTTVPKGREFREERVQPDLFPETVATERATPAMFQRLQKSAPVRKEKARIAEAKKKAEQVRIEMQQAAREVAEELSPQSIQAKQRDLLGKINALVKQTKQDIQTASFQKADKLLEKVKEPRHQLLLSRLEQAAKDLKAEDAEFEISTEGFRLTWVPDTTVQKWIRLDEGIAQEIKDVKNLEDQASKFAKGSLEQRKAKALATQQRVALQKIALARRNAAEQLAKKETELNQRIASGLGLPGTQLIAKTREEFINDLMKARKEAAVEFKKAKAAYAKLTPKEKEAQEKPVKKVKLPSKFHVVPIKSKAEIDAEIAQRQRESLDDLRRRARVSSPEAMYDKLKAEEKEANTTFKNAKDSLAFFVKQVNAGEKVKNFPKYKQLSAEIDKAKAQLNSIRENIRLLEATQYEPEKVKRQPARGPVGGAVPFYDKKFTPDQLRNMSGLGLSAFSPRSYSVDDNIDFRIGDTASGGIDLEQANKRMTEVEQKAKSMGAKFKYFPTMKEVTLDILNNMQRQGVDVYETQIRGGVKPDGTVFVIGENHTDMVDLEKTVAHEFVGHYTVEGMLGEEGMTNLMLKADKAFATKENENGLENLAQQLGVLDDYNAAVISAGKFYEKQLADGEITEKEARRIAKTKGLREIIAYTMEKRIDQNFLQKAQRWIQELVGAVRAALKKAGLMDVSSLSTSDLFYMLKQANKAFEEGKPIAYKKANGEIDFRFSKPKYNPGFEELGEITDKIVGRQEGMWNSIKANTTGLTARVQFIDRFAALEALGNIGVEKGIIDSLKAQDMMYFARASDQRHAFVAEIATNGTLKLKDVKRPDGRIEKIIESDRGANLKDISQTLMGAGVGDGEATGRLFTLYLAAERAQRVGIDKLNFGGKITQVELDKALKFGRGNAAFQKAREQYNEYNRGLIEFAVQTGALSKEEGARLSKTNDYVPFYRMRGGNVELIIGSENPIRIGDIKSQPYLQELVGGKEAIMDFFTSSLQNTTLLTDMALRNLATRNAAFTLKDLGIAEIHNGTGPDSTNVIRFSMDEKDKDGKIVHRKKYAVINTQAKEDVFGSIPSDLVVKGMEGIQINMLGAVRALSLPANWLRKFVTRDPRYAVRQIFRDSMAAALTTGANITPVVDTLGEIAKMYGKGSEAFEKLQRRGVIGGQVITGAPEDMQKIMQQIASGKPGWDLAMAKLDQIAMAGDAGTRIAMYNSFLKQGLSEREATMAALEAMNFGRRGVSPSIYFLNATIPFFNAGIQGIDVLYRAFTGQMPYEQKLKVQKKLLVRGGMMALLTMAYAAMMEDDEAYKNAPPEQRYGNWFVRIPGFEEPFRVPIPFEVGLLFKAVPEGVYNAAFGSEDGKKIAKDLSLQLLRSLPGNPAEAGVPVPTAIKPFIETALNKSFFTGRDIVDARMDRLDKEFQYRDKTPELLKVLGPAFAAVGLSPVQVENFIRSYTGSLGIGIASIANRVFKPSGGAGDVEERVSDLPIIGGMFQPNDAGRVIDEAYDSVKEVQRKQETYRKLVQEGRTSEAQQYLKDNVEGVALASYAGMFRQRMGEITKMERMIRAAPEAQMSPEKKREELDKLRQYKITMAQQFKVVREQTERQAVR